MGSIGRLLRFANEKVTLLSKENLKQVVAVIKKLDSAGYWN